METILVLGIYGLIWGGILAALIYLAIRRVRISETENFEKRDN
ncbi:hypothetical protein [Aquimarina sp. 2201CG5-10]|nr:hypothetical protein [Aquimarina sp. 2201CG5-10]MDY8136762.1 hypothetical protein [Aquimarina sp. 2201CG5-10]